MHRKHMHSRRNKKILSIILVIFVLIVTLATSIGETSAYSETNKSEFENVLETQNEQTEEMQWNEDAEEITEDSDKSVNIIYDPQPATKEEVQTAITIYEKEYKAVLELLGFAAALKVLKPHWEFAVEAELMPDGYNCQLVDWDEDFGTGYYTFFVGASLMASYSYATTPPAGNGINISNYFIFPASTTASNITNTADVDDIYKNVAAITKNSNNIFGAMWGMKKLDLTQPFSTEMYLYMRSTTDATDIADGMTFTLQNDSRGLNTVGGLGEGLGVYKGRRWDGTYYYGSPVTVPDGEHIKNSLVIEFDSFQNNNDGYSFVYDPTALHCALIIPPTSRQTIIITDHSAYTSYFTFTKVQARNWMPFTFKWTPSTTVSAGKTIYGGTLVYTLNGTQRSYTINDVTTVFGKECVDKTSARYGVYWGFTGTTGGLTSLQAAAITRLPTKAFTVTKSVMNSNKEYIDNGYAKEGDTITYTIRVMSERGYDIGAVNISDELSEYVTYAGGNITVTLKDGTSFDVTPKYSDSTMVVETGKYLATAGDWLEISFDVKVNADSAGETVTNTAVASTGTLEPVSSNETKVTILGRSRKYVADDSDAGANGTAVTVGDEITYKIKYVNNTGSKANLTITDDLDEGVEYVSHSNDGVNNRNGNKVVWQISGVEAGADGRVTVTVRVTKDIDRDKDLVNKAVLQWSTSPAPEEPSTQNPVEGYKVTYNGNGGVDPEDETSHEYGLYPTEGNHSVHKNSEEGGEGFARAGYTFSEWNTKEDGTGTAYKPDSTITGVTEDIVLHAQWIKHTEFKFNKVDKATQAGLNGAVFTLYKYNPDADTPLAADTVVTDSAVAAGTWILKETVISGTGGLVTFSDLAAGYYQLVEDTAPGEYEKATVQWRLSIVADGALYKVISVTTVKKAPDYSAGFDFEEKPGISGASVYVLPNEKNAEFTFTKVQEDGKTALRGAQFKLYSWEGTGEMPDIVEDSLILDGRWKLVDTQASGDDGKVSFESLDKKDYQLVETKAPPGYSRPMGQWRLTADSSGNWTILGKGSVLPPAFAEVSGKYILPNMKGKFFPLTGFGGILNYLIAGLGIMAAAVAGIVFLLFSQKRKIKNK